MRHIRHAAVIAVAFLSAATSKPVRADNDRPTIVTEIAGHDLRVTVLGTTDYCATVADTRIVRSSSAIRIIRDRPSRVSRCMGKTELSFVVHDVQPGTYTVTYERTPLVAPARLLVVATSTTSVSGS